MTVFYGTENEARLTVRILRHSVTIGHFFYFVGVEWAEDGTFGGAFWLRVVYGVDEEREAEDIGEEDIFLSCISISLFNIN